MVRSAAAFGAHGVFLPERRAAGMTATAWRTSAGAAARLPIAQVTNLTRALKQCQDEGFTVVGLDADGETSIYDLEAAVGPLVVVVGSEGRGLSRLVGETCDLRVGIPMTSDGRVAERVASRPRSRWPRSPGAGPPDAVGRSPPRGTASCAERQGGCAERHCELRRETRQLRREASAIYAGAGAAAGSA